MNIILESVGTAISGVDFSSIGIISEDKERKTVNLEVRFRSDPTRIMLITGVPKDEYLQTLHLMTIEAQGEAFAKK